MRRITLLLTCLLMALSINAAATNHFPRISEKAETGYFPLSQSAIYLDADDYKVVAADKNGKVYVSEGLDFTLYENNGYSLCE